MNKTKKIIFGWCILCFGLTGLQAQNIKFKFIDGSTSEYTVAEIRTITFSNDIMHVNKKDGSTISWPLNTLGKSTFTNLSTGMNVPLTSMSENDLIVFPNPATSNITIAYTISQPGKVNIELLNPNGQLIKHIEEQQQQAGKYSVNWDGKDDNGNVLPTGTYICHVYSGGKVSTQKIVLIK